MPAASILIKPTSANCNMDCKYCFYKCLSSNREEYSKGFMSEETLEQFIIQAIDYAEGQLTFAFQGGEPTLAGIVFFRRAVSEKVQEKCKGCPHFNLCRGGCRRWRETGKAQELDLNYLCPAYELFFEHCSARIAELGKLILNRYGRYRT